MGQSFAADCRCVGSRIDHVSKPSNCPVRCFEIFNQPRIWNRPHAFLICSNGKPQDELVYHFLPNPPFGVMSILPLVTEVKPALIKHYSSFLCVYHNRHVIGFPANEIVSEEKHPLRTKTLHRWLNRDRNALWWHVLCAQAIHPKPVLRNWFCNRVRSAFREELKIRNMDENWKPTTWQTNSEPLALLTGYLRIQIQRNLTEVKHSQIRDDCGRAIDKLLQRSRYNHLVRRLQQFEKLP